MRVQLQTLEIIFERKMSNEKLTKIFFKNFPTYKMRFFVPLLFGPRLLSNLITFLFQTPNPIFF
jgi:glutathionyl-hydroquinone reductase